MFLFVLTLALGALDCYRFFEQNQDMEEERKPVRVGRNRAAVIPLAWVWGNFSGRRTLSRAIMMGKQ